MNKLQGPYRVSLPYTVSHQCCTPLHENAVPRTVRRAQVLSTSPYTSSHRCSTPLCTNDLPQTVRTAQVLSASPCTSSHRCSTLLYTNAVSQTAKTGPVSSASPFTVSHRCSTPLYVNAVPQYVRTAKALSPKENESFAGKVQFMDFLFSPKVSPIDYGGVGRIQCDNVSHHNLLHARVDIQQELHDVSSYYNSYIEIRDSEQVQPPMDDIYYCSSISLPEINLRQKSMNSAFLDTSSPFDEKINGLSYEDHRVTKLSKQSPGIGVECREKRKVKENHPKALLINETCIAQSPSSTVDGDKKQNDENVANPILHDKSFITPTSLISSSDTLFNYDTGGTRLPILEMPDTLPDPSFSPIKISENFSACASNFPNSLKSVKFSKPKNFLGQSILPQPVPRTVKLYKEESFRDLSYPVPLPRRSLKLTSTNAFLPGNDFPVDNRFQSQKVCCRKTVSLS
ncbi:uncharacterized protein [Palaemon carinicauda]|uniref:uncharacterized protein isoform X1 n=1 Tax=Palaemon carinicauda TaxID=392227 RepID=UPI0035B61F41